MRISIPKGEKILVYILIGWLCLMRPLQMIGIPHAIEYLLDVIYVVIFVLALPRILKNRSAYFKPLINIQLLMLIIGTGIAFYNGVSLVLIVWAWRKLFRFLVFFMALLLYFDEKDISRTYSLVEAISFFNFFMVLFEYFVLGYTQDWVGGLFGTFAGCNGDLNNVFLFVTIVMMVRWINKSISLSRLILHISMCLISAVIGEIKAYFIETVLIWILCVLISSFSNKKKIKLIKVLNWILVGIVIMLVLFIALKFLERMFPRWAGFFNPEVIYHEIARSEGYNGSGGDVNRLTFIKVLNKSIESLKGSKQVLGYGLGSWELAESQDILTSQFYRMYNSTHYQFFSLPWMYLECGFIGMVLYVMSFVVNGLSGYKLIKEKIKNNENPECVFIGVVTSLMSLFVLFYNSTMRSVSGFMIFWGLAMVYIPLDKNRKKKAMRRKVIKVK